MMLVTVGASNLPFDRLVEAADELPAGGETVVVQYGAARVRPRRAVSFDYLPFAEFQEWVSKARLVICHAGIGSVGLCLSLGLHPIVVPRRKRLHECIDEHQVTFARRVAALGLATVVEDVSLLSAAVQSASSRQARTGLSQQLADELVEYIGTHCARLDGQYPDGRRHPAARTP
jgi:UDP-N-acetylglucosamine transferase subunit ALG13